MACIKAFRGMRYSASEELSAVVCPPYDIISDTQREEFIEKNSHNIVRLELPKGGEERYKEAGETLRRWLDKGVLSIDEKNGIYVYEMVFTANGEKKRFKGFVSLVKLSDFSEGIVLPHEETLSKAKQDRFDLMRETDCNFSQIFSLYDDSDGTVYSVIDSCSKGLPDMEVTDGDGTVHRMWCVTDEKVIEKVTAGLADKKLYIADGHHRYETALNYYKTLCAEGKAAEGDLSGYVMMLLADMENKGLTVFPTHRIVSGLENFSAENVIEKCGKYFDAEYPPDEARMQAALNKRYEEGKKSFALYTGGGRCCVMTLKEPEAVMKRLPDKSEAYRGLDVTVLHCLVLEEILGIDRENMANQKNLSYTRSREEALTAVDFGGANCAFILNPTKVAEIGGVAAAGEKMPQKSTYFYPKPVTGLVMNKFGK